MSFSLHEGIHYIGMYKAIILFAFFDVVLLTSKFHGSE
jgi:hypothetical protein